MLYKLDGRGPLCRPTLCQLGLSAGPVTLVRISPRGEIRNGRIISSEQLLVSAAEFEKTHEKIEVKFWVCFWSNNNIKLTLAAFLQLHFTKEWQREIFGLHQYLRSDLYFCQVLLLQITAKILSCVWMITWSWWMLNFLVTWGVDILCSGVLLWVIVTEVNCSYSLWSNWIGLIDYHTFFVVNYALKVRRLKRSHKYCLERVGVKTISLRRTPEDNWSQLITAKMFYLYIQYMGLSMFYVVFFLI